MMAPGTLEDREKLILSDEPRPQRFSERAFQLTVRHHSSEVEQGTGWGGDRNAVSSSDLGWVEPSCAMNANPGARTGVASDDHDVNWVGARGNQVPDASCGTMAEQRRTSHGQHCSCLHRPRRCDRVPH